MRLTIPNRTLLPLLLAGCINLPLGLFGNNRGKVSSEIIQPAKGFFNVNEILRSPSTAWWRRGAKTERDGLFATLWFNIAHYAVRPWPWILTALASLVLYPNLVDKESGYVRTLMDPHVFPPALRGIMLAAFAAAYMSTIGTQLNWGASYVVNDFYRRFLAARERGARIRRRLAGRDRRR